MQYDIDPAKFHADPYPDLAKMQDMAPAVFVPQLQAVLITRRDDIFEQEKRIDVFSSKQPGGLMTQLMGENMMRKDGVAHQSERRDVFPALSPKTVMTHWKQMFEQAADMLINALRGKDQVDLVTDYAMPLSGAALVAITGLRHMTPAQMDQVSQAMIDGCANYAGDPVVAATCHKATADIDDHITAVIDTPAVHSVVHALSMAGQSAEQISANVKLVISGGQNEPRDAIAGAVAAVLAHPDQHQKLLGGAATWDQALDEYVRGMSPIGMSPRQVAQAGPVLGHDFKTGDRVFLMFGAANRDPRCFTRPDQFDVTRDEKGAIPFGAGPHFCAGAAASRMLVAGVGLPKLFAAFPHMSLAAPTRWQGWAFRGPVSVQVRLGN